MLVFTLFEAEFPFRFPRAVGENRKRKWELDGRRGIGAPTIARSSAGSEPVALGTANDLTGVGQGGEALVQGAVSDAAQRAQFPDRQRAVRFGDRSGDALVDGGGGRCRGEDRGCDFEGERIAALRKFESDGRRRRGGAVFDGEIELPARSTQVKIGVTPSMELGRTAQRLAGAHAAGRFAGVMHHEHGELVLPLQGAQVGEQRCDFAARILVDAVQAHERIEHQEARFELRDGVFEALSISGLVESHGGSGDDVNVEVFELAGRGGTDALEPAAHDVQGILGGVQQDPARPGDGEAAQARSAGGNRDGEVQGEEGLAAFRFPADDPDGLFGPQAGDQPALLLRAIGETISLLDRQSVHRRRPATLSCVGEGVAKSSKNNFSSI